MERPFACGMATLRTSVVNRSQPSRTHLGQGKQTRERLEQNARLGHRSMRWVPVSVADGWSIAGKFPASTKRCHRCGDSLRGYTIASANHSHRLCGSCFFDLGYMCNGSPRVPGVEPLVAGEPISLT